MAYTNRDVANAWANQTREDSHSGNGNMSHSGARLYSYSTPIGHLVKDTLGRTVALLTTETYSVTTEGKHKGAAWRAVDYGRGVPTFSVPFLLLDGSLTGRSRANALAGRGGYSVDEQHAANVQHYDARIEAERARIARARVWKATDSLDRLIAERAAYKSAFSL